MITYVILRIQRSQTVVEDVTSQERAKNAATPRHQSGAWNN